MVTVSSPAVSPANAGTVNGPDDMKAIAYQNFNIIAIKAIQEQQQQMDILKNENTMLKDKMKKLEAAIDTIQ